MEPVPRDLRLHGPPADPRPGARSDPHRDDPAEADHQENGDRARFPSGRTSISTCGRTGTRFSCLLFGTIAFALIGAIGGYQAYHYTESVTFCGKTCHVIMKPEHTAYQNSPHARVACTECHVGSGAGWYAKSKLSGLYQVYATIRGHLSAADTHADREPPPRAGDVRAVPLAGEVLRQPAAAVRPLHVRRREHALAGEHARQDRGRRAQAHGDRRDSLAHEHIRQDRVHRPRRTAPGHPVGPHHETGRNRHRLPGPGQTVVRGRDRTAEIRRMDCVDCHNRPSHKYNAAGSLDRPRDRDRTDRSGSSRDQEGRGGGAVGRIRDRGSGVSPPSPTRSIGFYKEKHPEILESSRAALDRAIAATQQYYAQNMFPEMKVRWDRYPENIGHFIYPGCMRCHDGEHVSDAGTGRSAGTARAATSS